MKNNFVKILVSCIVTVAVFVGFSVNMYFGIQNQISLTVKDFIVQFRDFLAGCGNLPQSARWTVQA